MTWNVRRILGVCVAAAVVAGCSMADSNYVQELGNERGLGCETKLGHYFLAKSYLEVRIDRKFRKEDLNTADYRIRLTGLHTRADPSMTFCLDYRQAITSDDTVHVWKTDQGLLSKISSRSRDQSVKILQDIIHTIFTLAAGGPIDTEGRAFGRGAIAQDLIDRKIRWHEIYSGQFDPTNSPRVSEVNDRLKEYGFCIVTESQAIQGTDESAYCEAPLNYEEYGPPGSFKAKVIPAIMAAVEKPARTNTNGIFYRPRIPFNIYLFHRVNRKVDGLWRLRRRATIEIENHAPIVSVGINRTFFAERETVLLFDHGLLEDVQVFKSSQLENFIEIPITLLQHIAYLPTNLIQIRINQFDNDLKIRTAERSLLNAQTALAQKRRNLPEAPKSSELKLGEANLLQ